MRSSKIVKVSLILALVSISSVLTWIYFSFRDLPIGQLRTHGKSIVDGRGRSVILRGLNYLEVTNWLQRLPNMSELEQIKGWGFNVIRLPIYWEKLEPVEGEVNYTFIELYIDPVVAWCQDNGVYLVLDMHQWHTSSYFVYDRLNGSRGIGFPAWLCEAYVDEDPFLYDWWRNKVEGYPDAWGRFAALWCLLAERYQNYSYLAGYDLFNEPKRPTGISEEEFNSRVLPQFYEYIIRRMKEVDPHRLFIFEGEDGDTKPSLKKPQVKANLVYSQHAYTMDTSLEACREILERATDKTRRWRIPLWIGEFGTSRDIETFASNMIQALEEKINIGECSGWCWWCLPLGGQHVGG